jgi:hypothetical protein
MRYVRGEQNQPNVKNGTIRKNNCSLRIMLIHNVPMLT